MSAKKVKCFLFILCVSLFSTGFCEQSATTMMSDEEVLQNIVKERPDKQNPDKQFNLLLPINVYDKNTSLNILIPKGLKMSTINSGNPKVIRFTGKNIVITVGFEVSGNYQPTKLLDGIIQSMHASNLVTILESGDRAYFGYMDGYRLVKFSLGSTKNITHVFYMYVASGPYDSATVLYDMLVLPNETVDDVTKKLKDEFNANVHIVQDK